jgi:hypothetical protein
MPVIHHLDLAQGVPAFGATREDAGMTLQQWRDFCRRRGLMALSVEQDGEVVGLAVAESCPHRLHIRRLGGDNQACQLLLRRLVLLAGERDMTGWVAADRPDVAELFTRLGFVRQAEAEVGGVPAYFYFWDRNSVV